MIIKIELADAGQVAGAFAAAHRWDGTGLIEDFITDRLIAIIKDQAFEHLVVSDVISVEQQKRSEVAAEDVKKSTK